MQPRESGPQVQPSSEILCHFCSWPGANQHLP
uniref:Uncharacterized protein n=1 Tax=Anguilla anguilla TaxID=7936 RepID=A0A0E9SUN7_ANGAN